VGLLFFADWAKEKAADTARLIAEAGSLILARTFAHI
jgi:hypothetical protein